MRNILINIIIIMLLLVIANKISKKKSLTTYFYDFFIYCKQLISKEDIMWLPAPHIATLCNLDCVCLDKYSAQVLASVGFFSHTHSVKLHPDVIKCFILYFKLIFNAINSFIVWWIIFQFIFIIFLSMIASGGAIKS